MHKTIKVLYIDDNPMDRALVRDSLEREHGGFLLTEAKSKIEFEALIHSQPFDLVLTDFNILGFEGLQVLATVQSISLNIPVIIVTGTGSEEVAVAAMKRGAGDYVIKSPAHIKRLPQTIHSVLENTRIKNAKAKAEKELKESELKYKQLFDEDLTGNFISSVDGKLLIANPALAKMLGFESVEELLKINLSSVYKDEESRTQFLNLLREKKKVEHYENDFFSTNGDVINVIQNVIGIFDDNGELIKLRGYLFNNTLRKKAERELIDALAKAQESDRLKSAFLANMSHEIRTPMNSILGFAGLLKEPDLSGEAQQEYIKIIERGGARMLNTINDIVDISKIESGQMLISIQKVDINLLIQNIYDFFNLEVKRKGMQLRLITDDSWNEIYINTDPDKLYSILTNLIKNAIKYTLKGSVEFGYVVKNKALEKNKKELEFFVKDTGIGIPKDRQSAIFERFVQADIKDKMALQGSGLGLAICRAYVEMLGGVIWVESDKKGSVFYFTIPITAK